MHSLTQPLHIAFFGASVTEQDTHHATGEISGFVTYFQRHLADGRQVSRISAGSSDISDAAMIYVEDVIALKPDICVLDWVTPLLSSCDPRFVQQVYFRLMQHGILPVTVLFPRRDRVQADIPIAQEMAAICARYGLPFHDASGVLDGRNVDDVLRDVVHTTAAGAQIYAEAVAALLAGLTPGLPAPFDTPAPFVISEITAAGPARSSCRAISITNLHPDAEPVEFCVVMQQRVGPYSPLLDIRCIGVAETQTLPAFALWDAWCHRERQCIKKITPWHTAPVQRIELRISQKAPPYASSPQTSPMTFEQRRICPRGRLFVIATRAMSCSVHYS